MPLLKQEGTPDSISDQAGCDTFLKRCTKNLGAILGEAFSTGKGMPLPSGNASSEVNELATLSLLESTLLGTGPKSSAMLLPCRNPKRVGLDGWAWAGGG